MIRPAIWLVPRTVAALLFAALLVAGITGVTASPGTWRAEGWKTDFSKRSVDFAEIISGGPPKDGIPPIDDPKFKPVKEITDLEPQEPVIGLELGGEARAYPLRILMWHEIVNDEIGGVPVAVTYCPLCNTAIAFDRRLGDTVLSFGTTGKLRHSDLVMYDRQSESWWQQFTGEAIVGAHTGTELNIIPARLESFALFRERHPDGHVLVPGNPRLRPYGQNPYVGYDSSGRPFLYRGDLPEGIEPMARVVVVNVEGEPHAVTLELLRQKRTMKIGDVELTWSEGQASAIDASTVAEGRDVGNVVAQRKDASGDLVDVPYDVTFAFVFHAFHPQAAITKE